MTILERLRQARDDLTSRERTIANELEAGYPHAGLEGATALAQKLGVSAATVVRLVSKLGYTGYPDLQRELRSEVEARLSTPLQRLNEAAAPSFRAGSAHDVPQQTFEAAMSALTRSFGAFDRHTLDRIAATIVETRGRVFILGQKKARAVALYLFAQLNLCRECVQLVSSDAGFDGDQLLDVNTTDILIVIDVRRYVKRTVDAAEFAAARGARLIVVSDSTQSPLYGATPLRLCAATTSASAFDSYMGLILAVDVISNMVVALSPQAVRDRLAQGEMAWEALGVFTQPQNRD
jgi:DNA-binding MurR/RpiR family transcriptional regulator